MEKDDRFKDVKAADALGTLSRRTGSSRTALVLVAFIGFIALAFIIGMLWRTVTDGVGIPAVPSVEV